MLMMATAGHPRHRRRLSGSRPLHRQFRQQRHCRHLERRKSNKIDFWSDFQRAGGIIAINIINENMTIAALIQRKKNIKKNGG
jgi:hypothetical protein